jgi:hypothetical protein
MAKKVRKWNDKSGRRPIIGGVLLSLAVLAGLTVFLLFGAEHQRWSSNDPTSDALIFIFIPAVLVDNDDNMYYIYAVVIAFASVALIGAVYSILRREWSLAWIDWSGFPDIDVLGRNSCTLKTEIVGAFFDCFRRS